MMEHGVEILVNDIGEPAVTRPSMSFKDVKELFGLAGTETSTTLATEQQEQVRQINAEVNRLLNLYTNVPSNGDRSEHTKPLRLAGIQSSSSIRGNSPMAVNTGSSRQQSGIIQELWERRGALAGKTFDDVFGGSYEQSDKESYILCRFLQSRTYTTINKAIFDRIYPGENIVAVTYKTGENIHAIEIKGAVRLLIVKK